ncbi:MAG: hypothetical protein EOO90_21865 [Pedobacter sp.]|nr:MAG: hypothetical protein EOO90_21865 [Pedobacter sp.]
MDHTTNITLAESLFHSHLAKFTNPDMTRDAYAELFTEDAIQEFPYAPAPYATEVVGRDAIADYIGNVVNGAKNWNFKNLQFAATTDRNTFFVEFEGSADVNSTGKNYQQLYIGRITLRNGKISAYREFWNPVWIMDAFM